MTTIHYLHSHGVSDETVVKEESPALLGRHKGICRDWPLIHGDFCHTFVNCAALRSDCDIHSTPSRRNSQTRACHRQTLLWSWNALVWTSFAELILIFRDQNCLNLAAWVSSTWHASIAVKVCCLPSSLPTPVLSTNVRMPESYIYISYTIFRFIRLECSLFTDTCTSRICTAHSQWSK